MRLFVIEKKIAKKYEAHQQKVAQADGVDGSNDEDDEADEDTPLLGDRDLEHYRLPDEKAWIVTKIPILACLGDAALLSALWLAFAQAFIFGSFDSTIPTVAEEYYGFNSLRAGLLFLFSGAPELITGPVAGWCIDRFGTKPVATIGCIWLVPTLALLRLPQPELSGPEWSGQVILWAVLLALAGVGMGIFGAPSIVEAGSVVENYYKANPDFFGDSGPYAQLYGLNSMCFNAGLMVGPLAAGYLKDSIGYGNMNAITAGLAGISAAVSFLFIGGRPIKMKSLSQEQA